MEGLGTDFDGRGSVMTRRELESQRRKRGECVTCGRKCFQKKLLRMIPINDQGRVLNGRCLNCKPIDNSDDGAAVVAGPSRPATREDLMRFSLSQSNLNLTGPGVTNKKSSRTPSGARNAEGRSGAGPSGGSSSGDTPSGERRSGASRNLGARQLSTQTMSSGGSSNATPPSGLAQTLALTQEQPYRNVIGDASVSSAPLPSHSQQVSYDQQHDSAMAAPMRGQEPRAMTLPPQHGPQRSMGYRGGSSAPDGMSLPIDSGYNAADGLGGGGSAGSSFYRSNGSAHYASQDDPSISAQSISAYSDYDLYNHSINSASHATINSAPVLPIERRMSGENLQEVIQRATGQRMADEEAYALASAGMASHPAASALIDYYRQSYRTERQSSFRNSNRSLHSTSSSHHGGGSLHHGIGGSPEESYAYDTGQSLLNRGGAVHFDGVSMSSGSARSLRSSRDSWQGSNRQLLDSSRSVDSFSGEAPDIVPATPSAVANIGHKQRGIDVHLDSHFSRFSNDDLSQSNHSRDGGASVVSQHTHRTAASHSRGNAVLHNSNFISSANHFSGGRLGDSHTSSSMLSMTVASRDNAGMDRIRQAGTDFVEIVAIMRDYSDSAPVQLMGMQELSNLQLSSADIDTFVHIGAVDVICDGMRNYPMDVELQISGCRAIWNASATTVSQIAFVEAGAIEVIHMGMAQYLEDADVQEQSMATLANLAAIDRNVGIMIERNVASCIVEAMNKHVENVHVQKKGCSAITNMASHNTPFKKTLMEMGGGGAVVIAMVMHPNDFILQERALRALRNLSANCDENKVELANIGGIDAVISAMQVHRDSAGVQEAGAWTLSNLAGNQDNKVLIGDYGGIDVTIRAMWVHSDNEKVQEWCCRALFTLSIDQHNSNLIQEVGGISAIVNAMQAHVDSVVVQEMGCAVLCNLAVDKACKLRIVNEEALDAIVLAMVLHSEEQKVQERGCQVLMQLTIMENCKAMQASNIGELFRVASERFPDCCGELADRYSSAMEMFVAQYNQGATV